MLRKERVDSRQAFTELPILGLHGCGGHSDKCAFKFLRLKENGGSIATGDMNGARSGGLGWNHTGSEMQQKIKSHSGKTNLLVMYRSDTNTEGYISQSPTNHVIQIQKHHHEKLRHHKYHTNFCTRDAAISSQRHDTHTSFTNCTLFENTRLCDSILMLQIRDHVVELIDLQLILLMNSLSFGINRCLEDTDFVPVTQPSIDVGPCFDKTSHGIRSGPNGSIVKSGSSLTIPHIDVDPIWDAVASILPKQCVKIFRHRILFGMRWRAS